MGVLQCRDLFTTSCSRFYLSSKLGEVLRPLLHGCETTSVCTRTSHGRTIFVRCGRSSGISSSFSASRCSLTTRSQMTSRLGFCFRCRSRRRWSSPLCLCFCLCCFLISLCISSTVVGCVRCSILRCGIFWCINSGCSISSQFWRNTYTTLVTIFLRFSNLRSNTTTSRWFTLEKITSSPSEIVKLLHQVELTKSSSCLPLLCSVKILIDSGVNCM